MVTISRITDNGTGLPITNEEPAIAPNFITTWDLRTIIRIGSSSMCIDADLQQTHGKSTGFLPICLNQSCRKSAWTIQKGEGCFWTWKAPTESYVQKSPLPCTPLKKTFFSLKHFQWGTITEASTFWAIALCRPRATCRSQTPSYSSISPTQ